MTNHPIAPPEFFRAPRARRSHGGGGCRTAFIGAVLCLGMTSVSLTGFSLLLVTPAMAQSQAQQPTPLQPSVKAVTSPSAAPSSEAEAEISTEPLDPKAGPVARVNEAQSFVIDRTFSPIGREFFRNFYFGWLDRRIENKNALVIIENHSPKTGTAITVSLGELPVFRGGIPPYRRSRLIEVAAQAVEKAYDAVVAANLPQLLGTADPDMAKEEI